MSWPWLLLVLFIATVGAGPAEARRTSDPCARPGNATACFITRQHDLLDIFGLSTAESHRVRGEQIRRAMFFGRSTNPIVAVEFRRSPGQEPTVSIYLARESDEVTAPAVSAAVPQAEWERLSRRSELFDRALVALPTENGRGSIIICSDAGLDVVEATDPEAHFPDRPIRQRVEDTCEDGLAVSFADELAETAVRLIPACAGLEEEYAPRRLEECGRLRGDRMSAAQVSNRVDEFRWNSTEQTLRGAFNWEGTLDWMGQETLRGNDATRAWVAHMNEIGHGSLFPSTIDGESVDRVRWVGFLERWTTDAEDNATLWNAPVEMIWTRHPDQYFHIDHASVGTYVQLPARCHPGRLTGAGGC
jgi:hypothetical protein